MKDITYFIPIIPLSENSAHKNNYQYLCSILTCFSTYDCCDDSFVLPNNKTRVNICYSLDEGSLKVLIKSKKIFAGRWEKQLLATLAEYLEYSNERSMEIV